MTAGEGAPSSSGSGVSSTGTSSSSGSHLPPLHLPWVSAVAMVVVVVAFFTHRRRRRRSRSSSSWGSDNNNNTNSLLSSFLKYDDNPRRTSFPPAIPSSSYSRRLSSHISSLLAAISYFAAAIALVVLALSAMHSLRQFAAYAAVASSAASAGLAFGSSAAAASLTTATCKPTSQWPGWSSIKYAFIFGDSYTQTGFSYNSTDTPSINRPLGNPAYPGYTSCNGPNWVDYLTTEYNASRLLTYNLASGGATVDADIVAPYAPTVFSLKDQVHSQFLPAYTNHGNSDVGNSDKHPSAPNAPDWKGNDTVFAIWIGINDVGNTYWRGVDGLNGTTSVNKRIFEVYNDMVVMLYNAGARNFVFLTVPPVDRSPLAVGQGPTAVAQEKDDLAAFNGLLKDGLAADLKAQHADNANIWVVDTGVLFNTALDNPAAYPQTAGLKNTTSFCQDYVNGFSGEDKYIASCGVSVNKYFWLNNLHPTRAIHAVVAEHVSNALATGPNICSNGVDADERSSS